ncbi:MAG: hypothetical protein ACKVRO_18735 [Micropepsaceae bacterium]
MRAPKDCDIAAARLELDVAGEQNPEPYVVGLTADNPLAIALPKSSLQQGKQAAAIPARGACGAAQHPSTSANCPLHCVGGGNMFSDKLNQIAERYPLWTLVLVLRVPLIVVTGYALMVSDWLVEDVAFEAVRYVVLDKPYQLYLIAPLLLLAGFAIRFCGETMIDLITPRLRQKGGLPGFVVWILPGLLAAQIGILTGAEFIHVAFDKNDFGTDNPTLFPFAPSSMNQPAALAGAAYILIGLLVCTLPTRWIVSVGNGIAPLLRILNTSAFTHATAFALLATAVGVFFLFADWTNPQPAQYVGTFGVIALWAFAAVMYFSPFALLAHFVRVPVLLLLTIAAFAFSVFDLNDNHEFRTVAVDIKPGKKMHFQESLSLEAWLAAREKIDLDKYDRYPIFIVAAEGGGLRSAYFTNRVLNTLQAICPSFALHTIAITGVSGGSVGAASFVAQVKNRIKPDPDKPPCDLSSRKGALSFDEDRTVYGDDHLAALLAATLFPDAVQRILWWPIPEFDRARAIECSFERGLARSYVSVGDPCSVRSLHLGNIYHGDSSKVEPPQLFFNTTSVGTGAPLPIATRCIPYPRNKSPGDFSTTSSVASMVHGHLVGDSSTACGEAAPGNPKDLPLVTAAFLSARFPFVLPPARIPAPQENADYISTDRLLDGGLYEDSGTWLAQQIATKLLEKKDDPTRRAIDRVQIRILVIRSTPCLYQRGRADAPHNDPRAQRVVRMLGQCIDQLVPDPTFRGPSELSSPWRALLNTRITRGYDAQDSLRKFAATHSNSVSVTEIRLFNLRDVRIPLTWSLSRESRRLLDKAVAHIAPDQWRPPEQTTEQAAAAFRQEKIRLAHDGFKGTTGTRQPKQSYACAIRDLYKVKGAGDDPLKEDCKNEPPSPATPPPESLPTEEDIVIDDDPIKDPLPQIPELDRCENCAPKKP